MRSKDELRSDIGRMQQAIADIDNKCVSDNREITEDEVRTKNDLMDGIESYRVQISTMERQEKLSTETNAIEKPVSRPHISGGAPAAAKEKFRSLGDQLMAVMKAAVPGGKVDPRLYGERSASGLNETIPSDGGFLVQQDYSNELLQDVFETGILASKCRRIPISGNANSIKINGIDETSRASTRSGGILGYWEEEAALKTETKPKFRKIELSLKKLIGLCYATDELLQDAAALEGVIRNGFVSEFGFLLDDAIINGSGAGQPLGILNAGCLVSAAAETGQKAATVVTENIMKMWTRRFASQTGNYAWYINQNIEPQLMQMSLAVGTGGIPVYMPAGGISAAPYGSLLGRPVIPIEQAATLGTVGDIILANFQNGYIIAEKGGIQQDMSIHIRFLYDESVFRFVMRVDGQPVRASALTPYKGGSTATQSHFIALATRS